MFCLYESRKKLQIGSFLERKIGGGGVRKEERVNSTKKCTSTIYTSQRSECNILKKNLIRGKNVKESRRQQRVRSTKSSSSFVVSSQ